MAQIVSNLPTLIENPSKLNNEVSTSKQECEFILQLFEVLSENAFDSQYSVPNLCRDIGMSSSQLHRKLTMLTGHSMIGIIIAFRLNKAKQLLSSESSRLVSDIAFDCGFDDPHYFSRVFRQQFGVTPSRFRNQF